MTNNTIRFIRCISQFSVSPLVSNILFNPCCSIVYLPPPYLPSLSLPPSYFFHEPFVDRISLAFNFFIAGTQNSTPLTFWCSVRPQPSRYNPVVTVFVWVLDLLSGVTFVVFMVDDSCYLHCPATWTTFQDCTLVKIGTLQIYNVY